MQTTHRQTEHSVTSSSGAEPRLFQVPREMLPKAYPAIRGWLEDVAERSHGRWTVTGMLERFARGDWQLWMVWDGEPRAIVGTELHIEMSGMKCALIRFCTGGGAREWSHLLAELEEWARAEGCGVLHMLARKGWAKHLSDYSLTHVELTKELT